MSTNILFLGINMQVSVVKVNLNSHSLTRLVEKYSATFVLNSTLILDVASEQGDAVV